MGGCRPTRSRRWHGSRGTRRTPRRRGTRASSPSSWSVTWRQLGSSSRAFPRPRRRTDSGARRPQRWSAWSRARIRTSAAWRRMVDGLPDEADRFQAHVDLGMLRGLLAAGDGGDWKAPMLELRERLDGRADGALRRMWLPVAAMLAIGAVLLAAGAFAARSLVGDTHRSRLDSPSPTVHVSEEPPPAVPAPNFDVIVSLAKRRGFVFPSSEIYGGMAGFWDYGPLGVELKNNIKAAWWRHMVTLRDDVVGIDAAIIMNPRVWEASGHVAGFSDPMVDCRNCKLRFREDDLKGPPSEIACPNCGNRGTLTEARQFNLMFATHVGPVEESASVAYLRPETAQAMFVQFDNVVTSHAPQAAVRHRADRPHPSATRSRRATSSSATARVRADGDGVLRPSRATRTSGSPTGSTRATAGGPMCSASRAERLRLRPHDADELSHYSQADHRHRVRVPDRLVRARGHRRPHRLRPQGPRRRQRQEARDLRRGDRRAHRAVRRSSRPWASTARS